MKEIRKIKCTCDRCGKVIELTPEQIEDGAFWSVNLGRPGYSSKMDGSDINWDVCDECMFEIINEFKHKDRILNSGSNTYYNISNDDIPEEDHENCSGCNSDCTCKCDFGNI
jgi:hypothetical protein